MDQTPVDEKWEKVKSHYEQAYKIKFKKRPPPEKVEFLYAEMKKLSSSLNQYFNRAKKDIERYVSYPQGRKHYEQ